MAEPARQIYDPDDEHSVTRPNLEEMENGGVSSSSEHEPGASKDKGESPKDLSTAEKDPNTTHERQLGKGYTSKGKSKTKGRFSRRQKMVGLGLGGGITAAIISFMLFFLPALRLESYLSGIDQRVFGFASNAVQQRTSNLFERYLSSRILGIQKCGNKVTDECAANYSSMGMAGSLFKTWQDSRVEYKFFDKMGFKIESIKNSTGPQKYRIIDTSGRWGKAGNELTVKDGKLILGKYEGGSRIFGKDMNTVLKDITSWDEVMQRRSVRKYLTRKHDTKFWCFFACTQKDSIDNLEVSAVTKLKYKLIERVIYPMSPKLGLIMDCLMNPDGAKCSPDAFREKGIDRSVISDADLNDLINNIKDNPNKTLTQILIEKLLMKVMDEEAAQHTAGLIPVVGEFYLAASILDMENSAYSCLASSCLSKYAADINSNQYLEYYTAMRSAGDEVKAGALSASEVGALNSQFDDGGHSAGESLVYQAYNNPKTTTALLDNKAYAASTSSPNTKDPYLCADGNPIPAGQLVCPEKKVTRVYSVEGMNNTVPGISTIISAYRDCHGYVYNGDCIGIRPSSIIHGILQSINNISSTLISPFVSTAFSAIEHTPYVGDVLSQISNATSQLIQSFMQIIFPLPIQVSSPGRDKYDGLEAGGEVAASEFGKGGYTSDGQPYGLGGKRLSTDEQVTILQNYNNQQENDYQNSSLVAKLTDAGNPRSVASRFIAAMPTSFNQWVQKFASMATRPFAGIGSLWHPALAAQASTATIDAFGIPRFGYDVNDPAFTADPSIYTPEYCAQEQVKWQASKTDDPVNGIDEYSTTNPCLLERVAVDAASSALTNNDSLDDN